MTGTSNVFKMSVLPKAIYSFNVIYVKLPETNKSILKFIWNLKGP